MKKVLTALFALLLLSSMASCGAPSSSSNNSSSISSSQADSSQATDAEQKVSSEPSSSSAQAKVGIPSMDDINWEVFPSNYYGEDAVGFKYTNNTKYTITKLIIIFSQKDGLTKDDLAVFNWFIEKLELPEEELFELDLEVYARDEVTSGSTSETSLLLINGTYEADLMEQYELTEPDSATIDYIAEDGLSYTTYYSFSNNSYSDPRCNE